ncbi:beta-propeller fold lactonase family protein [Sinorhizobium meliloti]|nr:beta-propeller fold lactonase family protein [Sinorhizobium meliloti]MDX0351575.1 beta-propeller fold lactonase family protein [Sinorhizobium meliloti]
MRPAVATGRDRGNTFHPSFLTVEGTGRFLYAVHGDGTEMSSFHIGEDGRLQAIGHSTSAGLNPVDVALDTTGRPPDRGQSSLRFACRSLLTR